MSLALSKGFCLLSVSQSPPVLLSFILFTGTWKRLKSFPSWPSSWQNVPGHGLDSHSWEGRLFAWGTVSLDRSRAFWLCGSLDAEVAAGTGVRSDPCAALSFQHIPVAEHLPTGSEWGLGWNLSLLYWSGRVGGSRFGWGREPWGHPGCWHTVM